MPIELLIAISGAALLAFGLLLWLRRRPGSRRLPMAPRHPVVLAHGFMGFETIEVGGIRNDYFRGVPGRFAVLGVRVVVPEVPKVDRIAVRAEHLAEQIRSLDAPKVHIIAHSMGGLDARYAIARLGLAARVLSLITIGTPHRGTPLADLGDAVVNGPLPVGRLLAALRADGFLDLTTERMVRFNEEVPNVRGVFYGSVVASVPDSAPSHPLLRYGRRIVGGRNGENDGIVPTSSQRWGRVVRTIEADHFAQIGWSDQFDAPAFYTDLLRCLRRRERPLWWLWPVRKGGG